MDRIRFVQIQTISTCNAKCIICPHKDSWFQENSGRMSDKLFMKIISELHKIEENLNTGKICPYLMNEPFTDSKIIERIKILREEFPNVLIEVSTNAELMTPEKSRRLIDILADSPHDIWISRHGISPEDIEVNMKIDGVKSLENIIYLLKEADGRMNIAIKGFVYSFDEKIILVKPRQFVRYWNRILKENNINLNGIRINALSFHDRAGNVKIVSWEKPKIIRHIGRKSRFYCPRVDQWLHILWNGDVILCCNDYAHETKFGNIEEQSLEEIFNGKEYKAIYDKVIGNVDTEEDFICNRCTRIGG